MLCLFWGSAVGLFITFIGYPVLMMALSHRRPGKVYKDRSPVTPPVTVVLVVYNELEKVCRRLDNLLAQNYPSIEIIVVSDGSDDGTDEAVLAIQDSRIKFVPRSSRSGKSACLNVALTHATGDIVVFCDVRQRFPSDTITNLVECFSEERVGAVSGALKIEASSSAIGKGVGAYWDFEKKLRYAESLLDSCIGCTGAVYAIRRELFRELPTDTLLDDVLIPMRIVTLGYRVLFNPNAVAYDPQALDPGLERIRKRRTLAGNFQLLFRYPEWVMPWRNRVWWQLIFHKYFRLLAPLLLVMTFVSNYFLLALSPYCWLFFAQICFYLCAILGGYSFLGKYRLFSIPASFAFLNLMVLGGFIAYLSAGNDGTWGKSASTSR